MGTLREGAVPYVPIPTLHDQSAFERCTTRLAASVTIGILF